MTTKYKTLNTHYHQRFTATIGLTTTKGYTATKGLTTTIGFPTADVSLRAHYHQRLHCHKRLTTTTGFPTADVSLLPWSDRSHTSSSQRISNHWSFATTINFVLPYIIYLNAHNHKLLDTAYPRKRVLDLIRPMVSFRPNFCCRMSSASRHQQIILASGLTKIIIVKENLTSNSIN